MRNISILSNHDDVIKWKHFPRHWPFVLGIHRSPVNSQHKGQWRGALKFSLICAWINSWVNNREAGDLRRHCTHYDVIVIPWACFDGPLVHVSWGQCWPMNFHYNDVTMSAIASQITSLTIVYWSIYSGRLKKTSKLRVTGFCAGNSPVTGEFSAQMACNAENFSIWWRHHVLCG